MKSTLESLIHPYLKSDFVKSYDKNTPFVVHDLKESIKALTDLPILKSINSIFELWTQDVDVCPSRISDEEGAIKLPTSEAKKQFEKGRVLLFNDVNTTSPVLKNWIERLRQDIGLSSLTYSRNLIYVTKEGGGTDTHFDQNMNFIIQMHGTKKWWVAPNKNVENPLTRYTVGHPIDLELEAYSVNPMPKIMPHDATEFTLKPGSMLFVPRGSWHNTKSLTDSLSLNFTFSAPTWIDIFSTALKGRLAQSPQWRETANYVSDSERSHEAIEKFNTLLRSLSNEAPYWKAEDILDAIETE